MIETIEIYISENGYRWKEPLEITYTDAGMMEFRFEYCEKLLLEIKNFEKRKWEPEEKFWYAPITHRNLWLLAYLKRSDASGPYARYEKPLLDLKTQRKSYSHQGEMFQFEVTRKQCIIAGSPGVGKTLAGIEGAEYAVQQMPIPEAWWVGPKSAVREVSRQLKSWKSKVNFKLMGIEEMVKAVRTWDRAKKPPRLVVLDEAHKYKTPTSIRSQQALYLANAMRDEYGLDFYLWLLTGTPAPKSPSDWWMLCEIACPGFLRESSIFAFNQRVGVVRQEENSAAGGVYNKLYTWRDSELKCLTCGELREHDIHDPYALLKGQHQWVPGINEVAKLSRRMHGLVLVKTKEECLDLPDKIFRIIECTPTPQILQLAKVIRDTATNTITGITRLRELSDGFQYFDEADGTKTCDVCGGSGIYKVFTDSENPGEAVSEEALLVPGRVVESVGPCDRCEGKGKMPNIVRKTRQVPCPKEDVLVELLEEYEDVGRIVIFGGFTGAVDRCQSICQREGWVTIRIDQGRWDIKDDKGNPILNIDPLDLFQDLLVEFPKVSIVANAASAGTGLCLTASPVEVFYSNTNSGEDRMQAIERIHRLGMDLNRGATIIDIIHLPTDRGILEAHNNKQKLQSMSLGQLWSCNS